MTINLSAKTETIYLPMAPCTVNGVTLEFSDSEGTTITRSTSNNITLKKGYIVEFRLDI